MTDGTKRTNIERAPSTERETGSDELSDQVTNDSLGTTDTADSTGLDSDLQGTNPSVDHESVRKGRANL